MPTMEEQVVDRVKRLFVACHQRTTDCAEDVLLTDVSRLLRSGGRSFLLGERGARRGAAYELTSVALRIQSSSDRPDVDALVQAAKVEAWREAEALVRRPHTFEVLKQLPELRQIISNTAVGAVSAAAGGVRQAAVAAGMVSHCRRKTHPRTASDDGSDAVAKQGLQLYRTSNLESRGTDQPSLLPLLVPQLRLQLAAEVAAGMLCPGQAPPPDTLQHASALQLFVDEALRHVNAGLQPGIDHRAGAPDAAGATEAAVADTLAATEGSDVPAPAPGKAGRWLLAPHLALQLQLPPQQLLATVCELWRQQLLPSARCSHAAAGDAGQGTAAAEANPWLGLLQPQHQDALADLLQGLEYAEQVYGTMQSSGVSKDAAVASLLSPATSTGHFIQHSLPAALVVGFLQRQWASSGGGTAAAWQAAVPVQAALLLLVAEQLTAAMADAVQEDEQRSGAGSPDDGEPAGPQDCSGDNEGPAAALLSKVLELLQLLRNFSDWNAALDAAAGGQPLRGGSSSSTVVSEEPPRFFSSSGPLSCGLWGLSEPPGFGLWASTWPAAPAAAGAALVAAVGRASTASSCWSLRSEASLSRAAQCQQLLQQLAAQVLLAQGCWGLAVHSIDTALLRDARVLHSSPAALQMLLDGSSEEAASSLDDDVEALEALLRYGEQLQQGGISVGWGAIVTSIDLQARLSEVLLQHRAQQLEAQGLQEQLDDGSTDWLSGPVLPAAPSPAAEAVRISSTGDRSKGSSRHSSQVNSRRSSSEDSGSSGSSACWQARQRCSGDSDGDVSSDEPAASAVVGIAADPWSSGCGEPPGGCCNGSSAPGAASVTEPDATSASSGRDVARQTLAQGRLASRQLGGAAAAPLTPLCAWLKRQHASQRVSLARAREWWHSDRRQQAAAGAVAGIPEAEPRSSRASSSAGGLAGQQRQQQQQQGARHADSGFWRSGEHDRHPACNLCRSEQEEEQRKKQDGREGRASRHTGVFSSPAVAWSDPFMWRRLLWQLLGKLSPAAQAFYARSLAICPHCCSTSVWSQIARSVKACLWTGADAECDLTDLSLIGGVPSTSDRSQQHRRLVLLKQHARALNGSFIETYRPGCTVLARQVLLALSPLHHAVLPAPETAGLCPSSFPALAGKLLQQHLLSRPVLDGFQHDNSSRASSSDFWWHIGLRRWVGMQRGASQHGSQPVAPTLSLQELEQELYANPDARLYAAGFAARQLCGSVNSVMPVLAGSSAALHQALVVETRAQQAALICGPAGLNLGRRRAAELGVPEQRLKDEVACQVAAAAASSLCVHDRRLLLRLLQQLADAHFAPSNAGVQALGELLEEAQLLQDAYGDEAADSSPSGGGQAAAEKQLTAALERALGRLLGSGFCQASDVQQLLLSGPAMVEGLLPPGRWWQKQRELLELDSTCDACGKISTSKAVCCRGCECALYCSRQCQEADAEDHALVCDRLRTTPQDGPGEALLLRLLQPEPGEPACLSSGGGGLARCGADSPDGALVPLADFALHAAKEVRALGGSTWHVMSMVQSLSDTLLPL